MWGSPYLLPFDFLVVVAACFLGTLAALKGDKPKACRGRGRGRGEEGRGEGGGERRGRGEGGEREGRGGRGERRSREVSR